MMFAAVAVSAGTHSGASAHAGLSPFALPSGTTLTSESSA